MLYYAIVFAVLALVAGLLGFMALERHPCDDRQDFAFRFPGPLRDLAGLWQEEANGSLILVGVGSLALRLP